MNVHASSPAFSSASSSSSSEPSFQSPDPCSPSSSSSDGSMMEMEGDDDDDDDDDIGTTKLDHLRAKSSKVNDGIARSTSTNDGSHDDGDDDNLLLSTQLSAVVRRSPRKRLSPSFNAATNTPVATAAAATSATSTTRTKKKRKVSMSPITDTLAKASTQATTTTSKQQQQKSQAPKADAAAAATNAKPKKSPALSSPQDEVIDLVDDDSPVTSSKTKPAPKNKKSAAATKAKAAAAIAKKVDTKTMISKRVDAPKPKSNPSVASKAASAPVKSSASSAKAKAEAKMTKTAPADAVANTAAVSAKKKPKSKKKTFEDELLNILFVSCQPYTIKDLAKSMGPSASETSVNYCLLSLIDKQWVMRKEFQFKNRTKELVWANQECKSKELVDKLQFVPMAEIATSRTELAGLQQQQKAVHSELSTVLAQPSNEELSLHCQAAEARVQELRSRLDAMKQRIATGTTNGGVLGLHKAKSITATKNASKKPRNPIQLKKKINGMRDEWRKRKVKCNDFVEQLADGMEKKAKDVIKLLELETDEMVNAKLPAKYDV